MAARTVEIAFLGSTSQLEAALARAGLVARESGSAIGDSFDSGSTKAGNALDRLGQKGASFGIPFSNSLSNIGKKFEEADTKGAKFTQTMSTLGGATLIATGAAFAGVAFEATKLATGFEKSVASIAGNAGITTEAAKKIGQAFLDTAGKSVYSGNEMAAAFAPVAGQLKLTEGHALTAGESLKFMTSAGDLAEASQTSLAGASSALSDVMQTYHLRVGEASKATDVLFNTSRALDIPVQTVATSVDKLHGKLGDLAPSMGEVGGLMIELGQNGLSGSKSLLAVNTAMTTLLGGSTKVKDVLSALGIQVYDSSGKFVGMQSVIAQLQPVLAGMDQQQQHFTISTLFGKTAVGALTNTILDGVPAFQKAQDAATKLGTAHGAAALQAQTLSGQIKTAEAAVTDIATKIGVVLIPIFTSMVHSMSDVVTWLEKNKTVAEALAISIGSVLALAVAVFAEQKAVAFGKSVAGMVDDLGKLVNKIPDVVNAIGKMGSAFSGQATVAKQAMGDVNQAVVDEEAPMTASSAKVGGALAGGLETGVTTGAKDVTTGLATIEGDVAAAAPGFGAAGKTDGAALDAGVASAVIADAPEVDASARTLGAGAAAAFTSALGPLAAIMLAPTVFNWAENLGKQAVSGWTKTTYQGAVSGPGQAVKQSQSQTAAALAAAPSFATPASWASSFLATAGIPSSPGAIQALEDFQAHEGPFGTQAAFNPLNVSTGGGVVGTGKFSGTPAENYATPQQGLAAEVGYFKQYGPQVLTALATGNVAQIEAAVKSLGPVAFGNDTATPWQSSPQVGPSAASLLPASAKAAPGTSKSDLAALDALMNPAAKTKAGAGGAGGASAASTAAAVKAAAAAVVKLHQEGMDFLKNDLPKVHSTSLAVLDKELTSAHQSKMQTLVQNLDSTHNKKLVDLANRISSDWKIAANEQKLLVHQDTQQAGAALNDLLGKTHASNMALLTGKVSDVHQKSLAQLNTELNATHTKELADLVGKLNATHNTALMGMATKIEAAYQAAEAARTALISADTTKGQSELNTLLTDTTSTNLKQMTTDLSMTHEKKMEELVATLRATHEAKFEAMAAQIENTWGMATTNMGIQLAASTQTMVNGIGGAAQAIGGSAQALNTSASYLANAATSLESAAQTMSTNAGTLAGAGTAVGLPQSSAATEAAVDYPLAGMTGQTLANDLAGLIVDLQQPAGLTATQATWAAGTFSGSLGVALNAYLSGTGSISAVDTIISTIAGNLNTAGIAENWTPNAPVMPNTTLAATAPMTTAVNTLTTAVTGLTTATNANTVATAAATGPSTVINIEGIPTTDAAAIASEIGWHLRTAIAA